jgi:hypothetical protein
MTNRPRVYISFAHTDGMEFVRRLGFALSLYADVYWDRRVQTGEHPAQIRAEIDRCDYFLLVTTPYSLASKWCELELVQAYTHGKAIALAHIYSGEGMTDPELDNKFTYGDFTENFEAGFRTLTTMILGQPYPSWESFSGAPVSTLLNYMKAGVIPAAITKQVGEQVLVQKMWGAVTDELGAKKAAKVFFSTPLTASGFLTQSKALADQFEKIKDKRHTDLMKQAIAVVETCVNTLLPLTDDQHLTAGQVAYDMLMQTKSLIETKQTSDRDFEKLHVTKTFFDFDVAEQLRATINDYARRSRGMY